MELLKGNAKPPVPAIKLEGEIKYSKVGLNEVMEVRGFIVGPQGEKHYVCNARFEFIDPQMLRSLLKFGEEGRQTKYGHVTVVHG